MAGRPGTLWGNGISLHALINTLILVRRILEIINFITSLLNSNMGSEDHLGMLAKDLPPDKMERLLREGYSISPNSGRLRKRIRSKRARSPFSKRKAKKYTRIMLWTFLIVAFVISLVIIIPELAVDNGPQLRNQRFPNQKR